MTDPGRPPESDPASGGRSGRSDGPIDRWVPGRAPADAGPLSLDLAHELLKNERRRFVLDYLADADVPVSMNELSGAVAARENDKPVEAVTAEERKRAYVGLHQSHLPKLDEAGVVAFDGAADRISLGEHAAALDRYRPGVRDRPSDVPYLLLSAVGVLALLASLVVETVGGTATSLIGLAVLSLLPATVVAVRLYRRLD